MDKITAGLVNLTITTKVDDRPHDEYEPLLEGVRKSFNEALLHEEPLFYTDADNLFDIYLNNLPEEARQYYNCNACRHFVNRYGGLVRIEDDGSLIPVMWTYAPQFFVNSVRAMRDAVSRSNVTGMFVTSDKRLGTPKTGEWEHMAVDVPKSILHISRLNTAQQLASKKNEEFRMLRAALLKYDIETVETAINLLRSNSLYRGEKFLGIAEWFHELQKKTKERKHQKFVNTIWKIAVAAPEGFCHVSSGMLGTLLDDIREGYEFDEIKHRFNEKMDPMAYMRPKVNPGVGNVKRAEEIVSKLGLENSLKRRFARLDEIETVWKPRPERVAESGIGVFASIKTKQESSKRTSNLYAPATTMTWEKFQRVVLPDAKKIEVKVGYSNDSFAAIATAEDYDAPPIIQWDKEDRRNPFSWYLYHGGSSASSWNLNYGYNEVTGIALQPNLWQPGYEHHGNGVFFILKNCKDARNKAIGLFPEIMRGELREVRSTIEAYSKTASLSGYEEASACGLCRQSSSTNWNLRLRVTTDVGVREYILDRWD